MRIGIAVTVAALLLAAGIPQAASASPRLEARHATHVTAKTTTRVFSGRLSGQIGQTCKIAIEVWQQSSPEWRAHRYIMTGPQGDFAAVTQIMTPPPGHPRAALFRGALRAVANPQPCTGGRKVVSNIVPFKYWAIF